MPNEPHGTQNGAAKGFWYKKKMKIWSIVSMNRIKPGSVIQGHDDGLSCSSVIETGIMRVQANRGIGHVWERRGTTQRASAPLVWFTS